MRTVTHEVVDVGGCPVHLTRRAGDSELKVWLVHGLGGWSATWRLVLEHPAMQGWDVYVPDLPGSGRSPASGHRSLGDLAGTVTRLVEMVTGDAPVALVGHSMGGTLGTLVAADRPPWLTALMNVEGNLVTASATVGRLITETDDFAAWFEKFADDIYRHGVEGYLPLRQVHAGFLLCDREQFRSLGIELYREPVGETFVGLTVPHVYVRGTDFPAEAAEFLDQHDVEVDIFDGSGHFPMLDAPDAFCTALDRWLSERAGQRTT